MRTARTPNAAHPQATAAHQNVRIAADDALHAAIGLAGSRRLLDPDQLGALVGRPVRITRIRVKDATSLVVGWQAAHADEVPRLEDIGWAAIFASEDKIENTRRRAAATDGRLEAVEGTHPILVGDIATDPRLGRTLASARDRADLAGARVLSWNPMRRIVLDLSSGHVLRIDPTGMRDIRVAEQRFLAAGVPVLPSRALDSKQRMLRAERWGTGDLATAPDPSAARTIGGLLARAHRGERAGADRDAAAPAALAEHGAPEACAGLRPARIGDLTPDVATAMGGVLTRIPARSDVPGETAPSPDGAPAPSPHGDLSLADIARDLAERTGAALADDPGPDAMIHGDLSPDQVLVDGEQVRLIDLDRAGIGPIGADLGSWIAASETLGAPMLADAFLQGYRDGGGTVPAALPAWIARAHLAAALEPLRRLQGDWPALVQARLDRADRALQGQAPSAVSGTQRAGTDADGGGLGSSAPASEAIPEDPELPGLARALAPGGLAEGGTLIGHKPGKRAVLRTRAGDYVKVVRAGRTRRILRALDRAAAFDGPFVMPQVIASDDELVATSPVPGTPLHHAETFTEEEWERACTAVMKAWLQAARDSEQAFLAAVAADQEPHGVEAERAVLTRWRLEAREAGEDQQREQAVLAADARLAELAEPRTVTTVHRDLHDKQLLFSGEHGAGLIDVDTACPGDPAVDLGNLRAHATWRVAQGLWSEARAEVLREAIDEAAGDLGVPSDRVAAFEHATIARLACVYAVRGSAEDAAAALTLAQGWSERVGGS